MTRETKSHQQPPTYTDTVQRPIPPTHMVSAFIDPRPSLDLYSYKHEKCICTVMMGSFISTGSFIIYTCQAYLLFVLDSVESSFAVVGLDFIAVAIDELI